MLGDDINILRVKTRFEQILIFCFAPTAFMITIRPAVSLSLCTHSVSTVLTLSWTKVEI